MYEEHCVNHSSRIGRPKINAERSVYVFLWYIGNTLTFRQLGNLFGIAKSTAWKVVTQVSQFLVLLGPKYIVWPSIAGIAKHSAHFRELKGIPNVVGAIDGTHIRIKAPKHHPQDYFNRKSFYSLNLQVVVDSKKKFIDVYCGEPGSLHDNRVLRRSELYKKCNENTRTLFPENCFLLGDSAYAAQTWIIPPFKDYGALSIGQTNFNHAHSCTRITVENAIGLLKTKFRRLLHFTEQIQLHLIVNLIYSACVLHNMCLIEEDTDCTDEDPEILENYVEQHPNTSINGEIRRDLLLQQLLRENLI